MKRRPPPPRPPTPAPPPPSVEGKLAVYAGKRNFAVTPEPPTEALAPSGDGPPRFMIHKHDARRLHYDLRLEIEGALASWAVPNGPSFDPEVKRLAVETEDHPLAYAAFEGRIPDGEYGAGEALVWDRGLYETIPPGRAVEMRGKGHLDILLLGEKLKGRWHLVRTRGAGAAGKSRAGSGRPQWLLMKAKDEYASADYDVGVERPESVLSGRRLGRDPAPG